MNRDNGVERERDKWVRECNKRQNISILWYIFFVCLIDVVLVDTHILNQN